MTRKQLTFRKWFFGLGAVFVPSIIETMRDPFVGGILIIIQLWFVSLFLLWAFGKIPPRNLEAGWEIGKFLFWITSIWLLFFSPIEEYVKGNSLVSIILAFITILGLLLFSYFATRKYVLDTTENCKICSKEKKLRPEIPYCKTCFETAFLKMYNLIQETEQRATLARNIGLNKQANGASRWFESQKFPEPIEWMIRNWKSLQQEKILNALRKRFPNAKPFTYDLRWFDKFPLDSDRADLNIPAEGLKLLAKMKTGEIISLSK